MDRPVIGVHGLSDPEKENNCNLLDSGAGGPPGQRHEGSWCAEEELVLQCEVCSVICAVCCVHFEVCCDFAVCSVKCVVMYCLVFSVQCVVYSVY